MFIAHYGLALVRLLGFVVFLLIAFLSATFSKPPDNISQLAWMGLALWLTPVWAAWAAKHRVVRDAA